MAKKALTGKIKAGKRKSGKDKLSKTRGDKEPRKEWNWLDARGERAVEGAGELPLIYIALGSKPQTNHPFNLYRDLMSTPKALADTMKVVPPKTGKLAAEIKKRGLSRIIATGLGTSHFAAMAAASAFGAFADFDADAVDCGEFLTSRRNWNLPRSAFIVFSGSGRTFDANAAAKKAREGGAYVIAVTSVPHSPLTRVAHDTIVCSGGFDTGGSDTFHYLTRTAAIMLLALDLGERIKLK